MGDYQRLKTEAENEVLSSSMSGPRAREDIYYAKPIILHKIGFALSILVCAAVVIVFIWVLPCNLDTCSENNDIFSWNKTLYGLELKGQLHFVDGNLIGILRGALWGIKAPEFLVHTGGVAALVGKTGQVAWFVLTPGLYTTYLDCSILDIDSKGDKDCLVLGENGYLSAIHSLSGVVRWKLHSPNTTMWPQPRDIDLPMSIADIDNDGYSDLVTLSRFGSGEHRLAYISSKMGHIILEPLLDPQCSQVYNLTYDASSGTLHYTCTQIDGGYSILSVTTPNANKSSSRPIWKNSVIERNWKSENNSSIGDHKVIVSNTGTCPTHCSVSINVTDPKNQTIWTYHSDKAYVMSPVPLHFKHSITGFLLKFWQWHTTNHRTVKNGDVRIELIKERIVLITLSPKSGYMHVVNASQTDITQLCNATECQPQLSFQTQSALIVDLNGDGSQDLISYFVSYKPTKDDPLLEATLDEWELQSSVRVVRLEAELPKLYEAVSKH